MAWAAASMGEELVVLRRACPQIGVDERRLTLVQVAADRELAPLGEVRGRPEGVGWAGNARIASRERATSTLSDVG